jgi:sugar phosphate isomerase/epimerase
MIKNKVRIGNQTAFSASPPWEPFLYAAERGFDAFEWFPDKKEWGPGWEENDLGPECRRKIRKMALKDDIRLSVHAPWWVSPLDPEGRSRLQTSIKLARDLGASLMNIHLCLAEGIGRFIQALIDPVKSLKEAGIDLSIENTPLNGPEEFNYLFAGLGNPQPGGMHIGMCLDLGHANLYPSTRNDFLGYVDRLDPSVPIIHLHAHENFGDTDSHLPLFMGPLARNPEGIVGLVQRLKERRFSGSIILEQWPRPPFLLDEARARLKEIFASLPSFSK